MASVQCPKCRNSIRYHGEPMGIEFVMISSENWERIIVSEFNPKIKEYIDDTSYPKLYRTDTIEDDFPGMIIKYWKCNECGTIMFFDGQNRVREIYSEVVNYEGILEDGKEYMVFDDYTWDKITEAALPVMSLREKCIGNKYISLYEKCLIIKDKEKNIEKIYADKIMYGPDGKRVIKMTWEFI